MDHSSTFSDLQDRITSALVGTTRTVGRVVQEDIAFHRSLNPAASRSLDRHSTRLFQLANRLVQRAVVGSGADVPQLQDSDDLETKWPAVVDVVDSLLERADTSLDEHTGLIKRVTHNSPGQQPVARPRKDISSSIARRLDLPKPQLQFLNRSTSDEKKAPRPLLSRKPHATVPFGESIASFVNSDGIEQYKHPYETEIVAASYPPSVYAQVEPRSFTPLESTSAIYVDTVEGLRSMMAELKEADEIAIDLEHHETRSYAGLVCLMQISTRANDWIVDTLKPWRADLQVLNEVFTDPRILKVFHGAHMDIQWLQKDFGLYVVSLFDTYHAAKALGYPQASLASLLSRFVQFDADKRYQLADWRIRPLPDAMFQYARSDTHFLLYIYDQVRNELLRRSDDHGHPLAEVLKSSKHTALLCYLGTMYDQERGMGPAGWYQMTKRNPISFSNDQFAVFRAVHHWRDRVARENDDGVHYTMPKSVLMAVARAMPDNIPSLRALCSSVSPPAKGRLDELLHLIGNAKAAGASGPDVSSVLPARWDEGVGARKVEAAPADGAPAHRPIVTPQPPEPEAHPSCIRSSVSSFWGRSLGSSVWDGQRASDRPRLTIPLPALGAEIYADVESGATAATPTAVLHEPGARAEHAFTRDRPTTKPDDDVFVIRQPGGHRKRKAVEAGGAMTSQVDPHRPDGQPTTAWMTGEPGRPSETAPPTSTPRRRRRLEERETRKAKAHAPNPSRSVVVDDDDVDDDRGAGDDDDVLKLSGPPPSFDYAAAAAAQRAQRAATAKASRPDPTKAFNPYSHQGDGPAGARSKRKERPGRSMTYRAKG